MNEYLADISHFPILSGEEVIDNIKIYRLSGCLISRNNVISSNLRLVISIATKYKKFGVDLEDLVAYGNIGMITAIDKFDFSKNCVFTTYAPFHIKDAILNFLQSSNHIKTPEYLIPLIKYWNEVKYKLEHDNHKEATAEEINEVCEFDDNKLKAIRLCLNSTNIENLHNSGDSEFAANLSDNSCPVDILTGIIEQETTNKFNYIFEHLPPKQKYVLEKRRAGLTLEEIGNLPEIQLTKERIRQIEGEAIISIREQLKLS